MKIAEFANSVDLDEVAHNEPALHCLPFSLPIVNIIYLGLNIIWNLAEENFVVCFLVVKELSTLIIMWCGTAILAAKFKNH